MTQKQKDFAARIERLRAAEMKEAALKASNKTNGFPIITSETKVTIAPPVRERFAPVGDVPRVFELSY